MRLLKVLFLAVFFFLATETLLAQDGGGPDGMPTPPAMEPEEIERLLFGAGALQRFGSESAPIRMVMFQDVKCGMCRYFFRECFGRLKEDFIDAGLVQFFFAEFPLLPYGPETDLSAAALCAGEQQRYLQYLGLLYDDISNTRAEDVRRYAQIIGLSLPAFDECVRSRKYIKTVRQHQEIGRTLGVWGTPTFFLNGERGSGARPYPKVHQYLTQLLEIIRTR